MKYNKVKLIKEQLGYIDSNIAPQDNIYKYILKFIIGIENLYNLSKQNQDIKVSENSSKFEIRLHDIPYNYQETYKIFSDYMQGFRLKKQLLRFNIIKNNKEYIFSIQFRVPYYQIWNYKIPYSVKNY